MKKSKMGNSVTGFRPLSPGGSQPNLAGGCYSRWSMQRRARDNGATRAPPATPFRVRVQCSNMFQHVPTFPTLARSLYVLRPERSGRRPKSTVVNFNVRRTNLALEFPPNSAISALEDECFQHNYLGMFQA